MFPNSNCHVHTQVLSSRGGRLLPFHGWVSEESDPSACLRYYRCTYGFSAQVQLSTAIEPGTFAWVWLNHVRMHQMHLVKLAVKKGVHKKKDMCPEFDEVRFCIEMPGSRSTSPSPRVTANQWIRISRGSTILGTFVTHAVRRAARIRVRVQSSTCIRPWVPQ